MIQRLLRELRELEAIIKRLLEHKRKHGPICGVQVGWIIGPVRDARAHSPNPKGTDMLLLRARQLCDLQVRPLDADENAASIDGAPAWTSTDPAVAAVSVDTLDPTKAVITAGAPGTAQIRCEVDADLGDGVRKLTGILDVQVAGGEAVIVEIVAGTPRDADVS